MLGQTPHLTSNTSAPNHVPRAGSDPSCSCYILGWTWSRPQGGSYVCKGSNATVIPSAISILCKHCKLPKAFTAWHKHESQEDTFHLFPHRHKAEGKASPDYGCIASVKWLQLLQRKRNFITSTFSCDYYNESVPATTPHPPQSTTFLTGIAMLPLNFLLCLGQKSVMFGRSSGKEKTHERNLLLRLFLSRIPSTALKFMLGHGRKSQRNKPFHLKSLPTSSGYMQNIITWCVADDLKAKQKQFQKRLI